MIRRIEIPSSHAFFIEGPEDGVWYTASQSWFDRLNDQNESRRILDEGVPFARFDSKRPGVWLKIIGDWSAREADSTQVVSTLSLTGQISFDTPSWFMGGDFLFDILPSGDSTITLPESLDPPQNRQELFTTTSWLALSRFNAHMVPL